MASGSPMFSAALSVGSRLNAWNTKPTCSRRSMVRSRSDSAVSSVSPIQTEPLVTRSRPARQCIMVDLPDPLGPITAVKWPLGNATVTSSSARTAVSPAP